MKITIIAGARPNFMKIAPLIQEIRRRDELDISYRLVHTGQHYDAKMSHVFFEELNIPQPDINLEVGSGSHGVQTAQIITKFEEELLQHPADVVMVVGDVNSTLACSIVAKKLNTELVHVEAGIRSFDLTMPEEINRMVTDALSDHFFTTSEYANRNLMKNGIEKDRIHFVGNVMIDTLYSNQHRFIKDENWDILKLQSKKYWLVTLHRPSNVDQPEKLEEILRLIDANCGGFPVVFPIHPRTLLNIRKIPNLDLRHFHFTDPLGYLVFNYYVQHSIGVVTDSGGIQEETTVMKVPCLTLRSSTERPETIFEGSNMLINDTQLLPGYMELVLQGKWKKSTIPKLWDGKTAERIISKLAMLYG